MFYLYSILDKIQPLDPLPKLVSYLYNFLVIKLDSVT